MTAGEPLREELVLAVDAGTQSIRAALVDMRGRIRDMVKTPIEPYVSPHPGWAEHDADSYWQTLCETCRRLLARTEAPRESLLGVAVTTQRNTVVNVDRDGKPLRPAIVWLDQRKADTRAGLPRVGSVLARAVPVLGPLREALEDCEAAWIRQMQPAVWEKTHKYLFLSGYFAHRLTGAFVDSSANMVGYVPFDIRRGRWARKADVRWRLFPVEREKLPDLVSPAGLLGQVTRKASGETGIPAGLPVIASANDKACEILGAGCTTPDTACISFGTIATINVPNTRYVELRPLWPPFPAAVPGQYYTEVSVFRGAWMITWFKEEFGLQERLEAQETGQSPEQLLDRLIRDVPPASSGLVLQPYWTPPPGKARSARGSIIGFREEHKRAHLYRAILEGIVYAMKEGGELSARKNGAPIRTLRVSGGGSQSDAAMQIIADVFGIPAQRPHTHESSVLGAAIDAAVGLGCHAGFPQAVKEMTRVGTVFDPLDRHVAVYREFYERVYRKICPRLLPIFEEIQALAASAEKGAC